VKILAFGLAKLSHAPPPVEIATAPDASNQEAVMAADLLRAADAGGERVGAFAIPQF
jgi:hypothetical protein